MKYQPVKWLHRLGIPEDVLSDMSMIEIQEFRSVHIINYTGIAELMPERIRIHNREGEYCIDGRNLTIQKADQRELIIQGDIQNISMIRKRETEAGE